MTRGELLGILIAAVAVALAAICKFLGLGDVATFVVAAAALAALARLVGSATDQLGARLGSGGAGVVHLPDTQDVSEQHD